MTSLRSPRPALAASAAPRWLAAGLWLLAGLSASYWGLRAWGDAELVKVPAPAAEPATVDQEAVARGLGAVSVVASQTEGEPIEASRHVLRGVVRDRAGRGVALIASDGKPAKPYRIGDELPGGLRLRELTPREVLLGPVEGEATQRLSLPARR